MRPLGEVRLSRSARYRKVQGTWEAGGGEGALQSSHQKGSASEEKSLRKQIEVFFLEARREKGCRKPPTIIASSSRISERRLKGKKV